MNRTWRVLLIVAVGGLSITAVAALVVQAAVLVWQAGASSTVSLRWSDTLLEFLDEQIDAGYEEAPRLHEADPLLNQRKILLHHSVNARTAKDVTARLMFLDSLDSAAPIDLFISTQGGWVDSAFAIIDAMRLIDAPVNTWAVGGCYSAGALILASGTGRRIATESAIIMIHANASDSLEEYSYERLDRKRYESVWRRTATLPREWFPMTADDSYYLSAEEAARFNVVDEIVPLWPDHPRTRP